MIKKKKKVKIRLFDSDKLYVRVYQLAREGIPLKEIAFDAGVSLPVFKKRKNIDEALDDAYTQGHDEYRNPKVTNSLKEFILNRLSDKGRSIWTDITKYEFTKDEELKISLFDSYNKALDVLYNSSDDVKKELYLNYFCTFNYNGSRARQICGITNDKFKEWMFDENFVMLLEEMHTHKKDFVDDHFYKLIREGSESATLYAQKTLNADRGFGEKASRIEISGSIVHSHKMVVDLSELDLDLDTMKKIQAAMEKKNPRNAISGPLVKAIADVT